MGNGATSDTFSGLQRGEADSVITSQAGIFGLMSKQGKPIIGNKGTWDPEVIRAINGMCYKLSTIG